jgi:hypothetical protein
MANIFRQRFDSFIIKTLSEEAGRIAEKARDNASWSKTIPSAISSSEAKKSGGTFESTIKIDLKVAPQAAGFEYGSGEHGESGQRYPIEGGPYLAIPRERWPKYSPPPDVDPVVLGKVMHPGVKARPYLQPAIESERGKVVSRLREAFIKSYRDSVVRVEVISAEK